MKISRLTPLLTVFLLALHAPVWARAVTVRPPNIVLILMDDIGYADIGPSGATGYATPHLDRMAAEGLRLTNFHVSTSVCSASRAALLTGSYHERVGLRTALKPRSKIGLHDQEMTIAEVLKQQHYATAIFGKWHLGHHPQFLPTHHGFDEYFGVPYSNDMQPLPLIEGDQVVDAEVTAAEQAQLTTQYTARAVAFIEQNQGQPFFLYVPHTMGHIPLAVSEAFQGTTARGRFGDVMAELDWSVGEILAALQRHGLDEQTLVMVTSDNGPWLAYGDHAGSAGPLREGKLTAWEGGIRVPFLARWPGTIPPNWSSNEVAMTIDLLPTLAWLTGAPLPALKIDGQNIWPLLAGVAGAESPQAAYFIYGDEGQLQAVLSGRWKLVFPHQYRTLGGQPGGTDGRPAPYSLARTELALYNLSKDLGETKNLAGKQPAVVARLQKLAEKARAELGDTLTGRTGTGVRRPGRLGK